MSFEEQRQIKTCLAGCRLWAYGGIPERTVLPGYNPPPGRLCMSAQGGRAQRVHPPYVMSSLATTFDIVTHMSVSASVSA